jgi:hypothetical protein
MRARKLLMAAAAVALTSVADAQRAPPDFSGFWQPKLEREPSGKALIEATPDDAVLIDDTGARELAAGEFGGLRLKPSALAQVENYDFSKELTADFACVRPSVALYMQAPFPMEIYHGSDMIVFRMEYFDMYRVVFLDGREHPPADAPHSKSGHSVGRWEGDTLVVDTTHIAPGSFMNNGFDHSDAMQIVEHFRLSPDGATLWMTQLYEDSATFEGRAYRYMAWTRVRGEYVYPYDCDPSYGE